MIWEKFPLFSWEEAYSQTLCYFERSCGARETGKKLLGIGIRIRRLVLAANLEKPMGHKLLEVSCCIQFVLDVAVVFVLQKTKKPG